MSLVASLYPEEKPQCSHSKFSLSLWQTSEVGWGERRGTPISTRLGTTSLSQGAFSKFLEEDMPALYLISGHWAPLAGVRRYFEETPVVSQDETDSFIKQFPCTWCKLSWPQGLMSQRCKAQMKDTSSGFSLH